MRIILVDTGVLNYVQEAIRNEKISYGDDGDDLTYFLHARLSIPLSTSLPYNPDHHFNLRSIFSTPRFLSKPKPLDKKRGRQDRIIPY
jgi:hypothetical protein